MHIYVLCFLLATSEALHPSSTQLHSALRVICEMLGGGEKGGKECTPLGFEKSH